MIARLSFLILAMAATCHSFGRNIYQQIAHTPNQFSGAAGDPLFLTPFIQKGAVDVGRKLSRVGLDVAPEVESYSGYLTVNEKYGSNMFFWYFPALKANTTDAPLLLWLQGGPGGTDMFGLFVEVGPLKVTSDLKVVLKDYHWAQKYNLLFIDNPVGTGFSFTKDDAGYATNQKEVASDLYEALQQFLTLFPNQRKNEFYVTGESYAGKYIPAISYKIHVENQQATAKTKINLKGLAIGDGLTDPVNQLNYGDLLYQIALLDGHQRDMFHVAEGQTRDAINKGDYLEAFRTFDKLLNGDKFKYGSLFKNYTGLQFYFNFVDTVSPPEFAYFNPFIVQDNIRKAIHVGSTPFTNGSVVETHLLQDVMVSVASWLATLMDNYKVLLYNGQLDIIVAPVLTENFLQVLEWKYAKEYKNATRYIYKVTPNDTQVAGYFRNVGDFYQLVVRNAGHILPFDQPRVASDMISRFVDGVGFH